MPAIFLGDQSPAMDEEIALTRPRIREIPRLLTNLPEIISCLSSFQTEDVGLSNSLIELLSVREPIITSLTRLQSLVHQMDELHLEASLLSEKVSSTAQTAERVGKRVHSLDEEMRRVREAGERVGQVTELKVIVVRIIEGAHANLPLIVVLDGSST